MLALKQDLEYRSDRYVRVISSKIESQSHLPLLATDNRHFKLFRLEIASAILLNNPHISLLSKDIDSQQHIIELCDTYAIRLLLSWLSTEYGCSLFAEAMPADLPQAVPDAERIFLSDDIYPFLNEVALNNDRQLITLANAFLDKAFQPSIELAGSLYEHLTSFGLEFDSDGGLHIRSSYDCKSGRRKKGQFYTPPWVVDYCLEKSLDQDLNNFMKALQQRMHIEAGGSGDRNTINSTSSKKSEVDSKSDAASPDLGSPAFTILDPACGTGNFLLGILRFLENHDATPDQIQQAATRCLHGRDIDAKAVGIAIWSIVLFVARGWKGVQNFDPVQLAHALRKNLKTTDSVFESIICKNLDNQRRFDLVITNPPYISFGSRNQDKLLPSSALFLRAHYPVSSEYKIRLNAIFQEVALNYVAEGGKVCLFVPNTFLTGKGYARLRENLVKKTRLLNLTELPEDTIKQAIVGRWCVIVYTSQKHREVECLDYPVDLFSFCNSENGDNQKLKHYRLKASHLVTKDQSRFRLVFQNIDERLALKMECLSPLSDIMRGHTGIRARNGQKTIVEDRKIDDSFKRGIRSGSAVDQYSVTWDGSWLKVQADLLFGGGFDARVVENPKLLVRQTADRIIAAYDDSSLYHLNNIHSFSSQLKAGQNANSVDLHLVLALMNSTLWLYLYRMKTREDGRVLAQIDIETVESMPMPNCLSDLASDIANLARQSAKDESKSARSRIDDLVYKAYDLSLEEIEHIKLSIGSRKNETAECLRA